MKKELLISILIGFGLGLIITFGVYTARKAINEQSRIMSPLVEKQEEDEPDIVSQTFSLISPIDQSISKEVKISVSGISSPLDRILILDENNEKMIQADDKGNFETEISLISGENEITVYSFSDLKQEASKTVTVVYSTVEI